ncbi:testis-specific Y-encoded-like protein 2 isoform X2 [Saccopteryx leptura]|uniref:testis-specific Y-encoded-like protein 2 isoform X2 n=1 Tax=Saccopteryx leptura TaxID=249018 RepID=UPI00339CE4F4
MDRPDEGPPAKARRLSSSEPPQDDVPPPPPPPPPPLLRLPLPPPEQRPRPQEETEAAQFLNHPKISILINQRDEDIFRYLTNLQVQDLRHISMGYKMKLYFQTNPYFTNMVIVKEFQCNRMGRLVSHSTPIRWHRGQEPQAHRHKNQDTRPSFFSWFSNHSHPEADRIAEIIKNDLWVNPVRYYRMGEGGYRTKGKKRGKKDRLFHSKKRDKYEMVIMEDFDDYQIMKEIIGETSDSDVITDNDTLYDVKISDFMETTDCFETTDNEITDIGESLFDNEIPGHHETTYNNESADDSDDNTGGDNKNPKGCSYSNILDMCDSDNDGDNEASDDDDDSNVGDNEGSDDGNEGDNEGSDDDDRDIKGPRKHQVNSNLDGYKVKNIFEEESSVDEEEGNEEGGEDSYEEEIDDWEDSDMEDAFLVQNTSWTSWGKRG